MYYRLWLRLVAVCSFPSPSMVCNVFLRKSSSRPPPRSHPDWTLGDSLADIFDLVMPAVAKIDVDYQRMCSEIDGPQEQGGRRPPVLLYYLLMLLG